MSKAVRAVSVEGDGAAPLEADLDAARLVRGPGGEDPHARLHEGGRRLQRFQLSGLVGQPEDVGVRGVGLVEGGPHRQPVALAVLDHLPAAAEGLEEGGVPPRGVDADLGVEHLRRQLEPHLVVAAARGSVGEDGDPAALHLGHHAGHDHVAGDAGGVPVAALVTGAAAQQVEARFGDLLPQVGQDHLRGAAGEHALAHVVHLLLVGLAEVGRVGHDLDAAAAEPVGDRAAVETAGGRHEETASAQILEVHGLPLLRVRGNGGGGEAME